MKKIPKENYQFWIGMLLHFHIAGRPGGSKDNIFATNMLNITMSLCSFSCLMNCNPIFLSLQRICTVIRDIILFCKFLASIQTYTGA